MSRPRPALRIAILVAAIACLGLAMCARSRPQPQPPIPQAAPLTQQAPGPDATPDEQNGGTGTKMEMEEGKMGSKGKKDSVRFPATKAPGPLY